MLEKKVIKIVEKRLKEYPYIDKLIEELENEIEFMANNPKDLNSYIQGKGRVGSRVETEAMRKVSLGEQIERHRKWKDVIEVVLNIYKEYEMQKYNYLKLKFFTGNSILAIEDETTLGASVQTRYKKEITLYIAIFAAQEKLISMQKVNSIIKKRAKNVVKKREQKL